MSGHSKWATIKRKKGDKDAKRGKLFSKLVKTISVAARQGGDPSVNQNLRVVIEQAKAQGLPKDNIERAIRKGTGEEEGVNYEEILYEGVGPEGVQIMVDTLTDNRKRTASEFRKIFERKGGRLEPPKSVAWNFESKGHIVVSGGTISEEDLFDLVVEAGAENLEKSEDQFDIICQPNDMEKIRMALKEKGLSLSAYEIIRLPKSSVKIEKEAVAKKIFNLISEFEDHDDVQTVSANYDIPDELIEKLL